MGYSTLFRGHGGSFVMESRELTTDEIGSTSDAQITISRLKQENLDQMEIHALEQDIQEFEEIGDTTQALENYIGDLSEIHHNLRSEMDETGGVSALSARAANTHLKSISRGLGVSISAPSMESYSTNSRSNYQLGIATENVILDTIKKIWEGIKNLFSRALDKIKDWLGIGSSGGGGSSSSSSSSNSSSSSSSGNSGAAEIDKKIESNIVSIKANEREIKNKRKRKRKKKVREIQQQIPVITISTLKKVVRTDAFDLNVAIAEYLKLSEEFVNVTDGVNDAIDETTARTELFIDAMKDGKIEDADIKTESMNLYGTTIDVKLMPFDSPNDFMKYQHKMAGAYLLRNYSGFARNETTLQSQQDSILGLPYHVVVDVSNPINIRYTLQWDDVEPLDSEIDKDVELSFDSQLLHAQLTNLWDGHNKQRKSLVKSFDKLNQLDRKLQAVDLSGFGNDNAQILTSISYSLSGYIQQITHTPIYALHMKQKVAIKKYSDFLTKLTIELKREERAANKSQDD